MSSASLRPGGFPPYISIIEAAAGFYLQIKFRLRLKREEKP
jgi:hypothetical protein